MIYSFFYLFFEERNKLTKGSDNYELKKAKVESEEDKLSYTEVKGMTTGLVKKQWQ